jgi:hypothetical protein
MSGVFTNSPPISNHVVMKKLGRRAPPRFVVMIRFLCPSNEPFVNAPDP